MRRDRGKVRNNNPGGGGYLVCAGTNGTLDLVVVGGAKEQVLSCWMPLDEADPPRVTDQSLPGPGEALSDPVSGDVPYPHLRAQTRA